MTKKQYLLFPDFIRRFVWPRLPLLSLALAGLAPAAKAQVNFGAVTTYSTLGSTPYGVGVGDMNRDGRLDLVVTNDNLQNSTVAILLGAGTAGRFGPATTYYTGGTSPLLLALGDLNNDGRLDVVTSNGNNATGSIAVQLGSATTPGALEAATVYPLAAVGTDIRGLALGDVNGDGRLDIAAGSFSTGRVGVLLGSATTPGTFGLAATYAAGSGNTAVALADLNGDGRLDLVTLNQSYGQVAVLSGSATVPGTFNPAVLYASTGAISYAMAVADLNADGRPDVVVGSNSPQLGVLLNSATSPGTLLPVSLYSSGGTSVGELVLEDVTGDGRPDIIATCLLDHKLAVLPNAVAAPGTFPASTTFATSANSSPRSVAAADVNSDGRRDLVVANFGNGTVGVLLNQTALITAAALAGAQVQLYPNPAPDGFSVQVPGVAGATAVQATLLTALGQPVRAQEAPLPATGTQLRLSTAGLAAGAYLLRLQAGPFASTQRVVLP